MSDSYKRIDIARKTVALACAAAVLIPAACKAATDLANTHLKIEKVIQMGAEKFWNLQQADWNVFLPLTCQLPLFTERSKFPDFPYRVIEGTISDLLQAQEPLISSEVQLKLSTINLSSTASLSYSQTKTDGGKHETWKTYWIP